MIWNYEDSDDCAETRIQSQLEKDDVRLPIYNYHTTCNIYKYYLTKFLCP